MSKEKTKLCKHCKTEIPKKANVCPNCRKSQGVGCLRVIGGVLGGFLIFIILIAVFGGEDDKSVKTEEQQKNEFVVGDVVKTSDLKITFVSAKKYKSENEFIQPKKGNVYYKMDFEFENISDSDSNVSSYDFKCYADGYDMEQTWIDGFDLDATLSSGKKTKGAVFFEVPKDSKEVTLEYETNFWTENKIVFIVK